MLSSLTRLKCLMLPVTSFRSSRMARYSLSFLGLPVIPELKLTDLGLVDGRYGGFVPVWL